MKRYLTLEDGTTFVGEGFGAAADAVGELVFTTGMCGYIETLTDPSYAGQIVMQTFPMIGNYGIIPADFEGKCAVRGYVVHEWCDTPSNFRAAGDLDTYLKSVGIPGIAGIDTRALTRTLRECGTMNATITDEVPADLTAVKAYAVTDAVASVTCAAPTEYSADGETRCRVALLDFGAKRNIIRSLTARGCAVTVFPASTPAADILATAPDGVMLSNGPGDPAENTAIIAEIGKLLGRVPVFGICLGHQLMALAVGGSTVKLKYGHRGVNQPARDLVSGRVPTSPARTTATPSSATACRRARCALSTPTTAPARASTIPSCRAFSVQFHPEACAGPHDTAFLFDRFMRSDERRRRPMPIDKRHQKSPRDRLRPDRHRAGGGV